ncbi:MAG: carbohydrate porin [Planctomycetota bacterium]|nr:carbohydrate porin [Planctomycetota bacterium]
MLTKIIKRTLLAAALASCSQSAMAQINAEVATSDDAGEFAAELPPDPNASGPVSLGGAAPVDDDWNLWTSPTLTGDWFGLRSSLKESGIRFAGRETQFGFGVDGGIQRQTVPALGYGGTFKYTGRGEYDLIFSLEKFGGLPHGTLLVRAEHWYGQYGNVSLNTGAFPPAVFAAATPTAANDPGSLFLTNFLVTQPLSEKLVVFAGKSDVLGAADQDIFSGGDGTDQFVNQAFVANPAFLLGLPYTSFTAGAVLPQEWGSIVGYVRDPQDRTRDVFRLDNMFSEGVIVGTEVKVKTNFFELPGEQHVGGMWKHVALTNLNFAEPPPGVYPEPTVPGFPTLSDSYTVYYGFDQYLVQYAGQKGRGFGLFGRASISDGNPTPLRYFLSAGLGGDSPLRPNRGDTFGLGWYYVGASTEFGAIPQFVFGPRDGTGLEAYYNIQVTPWLNVTPDLQYIHPEAGAIAEDAFVGGLRVNMKL